MMVPYCALCGETEVGTYTNSTEFCSEYCIDAAYAYLDEAEQGENFPEMTLTTEDVS